MQPNNIDQIFWDASQLASPTEREAYLDRACGGDVELRRKVQLLLDARSKAEGFLETPAVARLAEGLAATPGEGDTRTSPVAADGGDGLDFLEPSDNPGSLGRLKHYEVQEVVGRGGMGIVLRAFDETLHRVVAVKVMAPQLAASASARQRFTREARAAAAVTHDHVVTIHAVEEANGLPYIVMQYVNGLSLQDRIDQTGPLSLREILRIGMQTARGLAAAHAQGLVHRDVKPANILLENGVERVKLTDFGLARAADDASLSQSGVVIGTPSFMSPEQAEGRPVDHRSDLFSLGSVLYAMCTGRPPFRAGTSMGVLKRVCEDTPSPIQEINHEIPVWLAAVVERLHAKDPAARYQSAEEVAELLGQHLAHVQHPSVVPLPAVVKSASEHTPTRTQGRNRWAVAAAMLLAVFAALGTAEATGVTQVRATVIRFFTPEGTLVVETDDPGVKVTVEGDGDLVITGAGPQEVRLRAGSYRLHAVKDGKSVKLDRDLVTISRGDRAIVRVRLESDAPADVAPKSERRAFVLLGGKGVPERKFDTLAEAVYRSSSGDVIEIRGNGPFVTPTVQLGNRALTLRAAAGFQPVIRLDREGTKTGVTLLSTNANLVLEGLELALTDEAGRTGYPLRVHAGGPAVFASNCRFYWPSFGNFHTTSRTCRFRNCEFATGDAAGVLWSYPNDGVVSIDNCVQATGGIIALPHRHLEKMASPQVHITRTTIRAGTVLTLIVESGLLQPAKTEPGALIQLTVSDSVIDVDHTIQLSSTPWVKPEPGAIRLVTEQIKSILHQRLKWTDRNNVYAEDNFVAFVRIGGEPIRPPTLRTVVDWEKLWGQSQTGSLTGRVRYMSGDPLAGQVMPEDFRLRPDSAGYRAGKDKKDLGADVDLVGPGAAYERWKRLPEYQQWLKETGQLKK